MESDLRSPLSTPGIASHRNHTITPPHTHYHPRSSYPPLATHITCIKPPAREIEPVVAPIGQRRVVAPLDAVPVRAVAEVSAALRIVKVERVAEDRGPLRVRGPRARDGALRLVGRRPGRVRRELGRCEREKSEQEPGDGDRAAAHYGCLESVSSERKVRKRKRWRWRSTVEIIQQRQHRKRDVRKTGLRFGSGRAPHSE